MKNTSYHKMLSSVLAVAFFFCLISCSKDKKDQCNYENAGIEYYKALTLYQSTPGTSSCGNLKLAAEKYYNAAKDCSEFNSSDEKNTVVSWMGYNCSEETEDRTGQAMFWTSSNIGTITVNLNDETKSITQHSTSAPNCGSAGVAVFTLPVGIYAYTASIGEYQWSGNISVTADGCQSQQLKETEATKTDFAGTYHGEYSFLGLLMLPDTLIITNTGTNKISVFSAKLNTRFTGTVSGTVATLDGFTASSLNAGAIIFTGVEIKSGKLTLKNNTDLTVVLEGVNINGAAGEIPPALASVFPIKNQRITTAKTFKKQ